MVEGMFAEDNVRTLTSCLYGHEIASIISKTRVGTLWHKS